MIKLEKILCPIDLSESSMLALRFANAVAGRYKSALAILHVLENPHLDIPGAETGAFSFGEAMNLYKEERQEQIIETLKHKGNPVPNIEIIFTEGSPYKEIVDSAKKLKADMIIMSAFTDGTHGSLIGSTTERVVRLSPCPVLTIRTDPGSKYHEEIKEMNDLMDTRPGIERKILLPTDFSEHSMLAKKYAFSLAIEYKAEIIALHIIENVAELSLLTGVEMPGYSAASVYYNDLFKLAQRRIKEICDSASSKGISIKEQIIYGNPRHEILNVAKSESVDMIVIVTHGRRGFSRFIHGSVAEAVARHSPCSVLSVKYSEHDLTEIDGDIK